jgi:hypothetical protein
MAVPARLAADVEEVRRLGYQVEVIEQYPRYFLVFRGLQLSHTYDPAITDLMMMADYQFPMSALDMFWTAPHVRLGGRWPQNADQFEEHTGTSWQRWSYHYAWNASCHSVRTHLEVFFDRLAKAA